VWPESLPSFSHPAIAPFHAGNQRGRHYRLSRSDLSISIRANIELANGHKILSDFSDIHIASEGGDWDQEPCRQKAS